MSERHEWIVKVDGGNVAGITLTGARVTYGRRTTDEQPAPSSAVLTLLTPDASPSIAEKFPDFGPGDFAAPSGYTDAYEDKYAGVSSRLTIGAPITVDAQTSTGYTDAYEDHYDGSTVRRFTGRITALDYGFGSVQVTAVDRLEQLARITVDTTRPEETDIERAKAYALLAKVDLQIVGATVVRLVSNDKGSTSNALAELYKTAKEAGAIVYGDRDGRVYYRTRGAAVNPTLDLPPRATITSSVGMKAELGEIVNQVTVEYGYQDQQTKARPTVTSKNLDSINRYGLFSRRVSTQLADLSAAQQLADRIIANEALPLYAMPEVTVTLVEDRPEVVDVISQLDVDDSVKVGRLPIGAPADYYTARVLGYSEELAYPDWLVTYNLAPSDYLEGRLYA